MDRFDDGRLGQVQPVVVAFLGVVAGTATAEIGFTQMMRLDGGAHGPVQHEDAIPQDVFNGIIHKARPPRNRLLPASQPAI